MRDLEAYLKLCEGVTDGPWVGIYWDLTVTERPCWSVECHLPDSITVANVSSGYGHKGEAEANAKFIAASRVGWPETIQELIEARKRIEELEAKLKSEYEEGYEAARKVFDAGYPH